MHCRWCICALEAKGNLSSNKQSSPAASYKIGPMYTGSCTFCLLSTKSLPLVSCRSNSPPHIQTSTFPRSTMESIAVNCLKCQDVLQESVGSLWNYQSPIPVLVSQSCHPCPKHWHHKLPGMQFRRSNSSQRCVHQDPVKRTPHDAELTTENKTFQEASI